MVYLVRAEETNLYKIGYTNGKVKDRVKSMQTGCPHKLSVIIKVHGDIDKERFLHETFSEHRKQGEWFEFNENFVAEKVIEKMTIMTDQEWDEINIISWRDTYEEWMRDSKCTDSKMEHFIFLAILEIMLGRNDIAIQRLMEFKEIIFSGSRLKGMPELTERIYNTE